MQNNWIVLEDSSIKSSTKLRWERKNNKKYKNEKDKDYKCRELREKQRRENYNKKKKKPECK